MFDYRMLSIRTVYLFNLHATQGNCSSSGRRTIAAAEQRQDCVFREVEWR
jgi:hypothetical protein